MGGFPGNRFGMFLGLLRGVSRRAADQVRSDKDSTDSTQHRSTSAEPWITRRDFFRYSNRQFMVLIITLSLCFAVNRHNNVDDLVFVLRFMMSPTFLWILLTLVGMWLVPREIRKSQGITTARQNDARSERTKADARRVAD